MSAEKEGIWAREYRQGRVEQVKQQRIANLIALGDSAWAPVDHKDRAIAEAYRLLFEEN